MSQPNTPADLLEDAVCHCTGEENLCYSEEKDPKIRNQIFERINLSEHNWKHPRYIVDVKWRYRNLAYLKLRSLGWHDSTEKNRMWDRAAAKQAGTHKERRYACKKTYDQVLEVMRRLVQEGKATGLCFATHKILVEQGTKIAYRTICAAYKKGYTRRGMAEPLRPIEEVLKEDLALSIIAQDQYRQDSYEALREHQVEALAQQVQMLKVSRRGLVGVFQLLFESRDGTNPGIIPVYQEFVKAWLKDLRVHMPKMTIEQKRNTIFDLERLMRAMDSRLYTQIQVEQRLVGRPDISVEVTGRITNGTEVLDKEANDDEIERLARALISQASEAASLS